MDVRKFMLKITTFTLVQIVRSISIYNQAKSTLKGESNHTEVQHLKSISFDDREGKGKSFFLWIKFSQDWKIDWTETTNSKLPNLISNYVSVFQPL